MTTIETMTLTTGWDTVALYHRCTACQTRYTAANVAIRHAASCPTLQADEAEDVRWADFNPETVAKSFAYYLSTHPEN